MCDCREGRGLKRGQAAVLLPPKENETNESPAAYVVPLRQAFIDDNTGHVNIVLCEEDYRALKRGIEHLPPAAFDVRIEKVLAPFRDAVEPILSPAQ